MVVETKMTRMGREYVSISGDERYTEMRERLMPEIRSAIELLAPTIGFNRAMIFESFERVSAWRPGQGSFEGQSIQFDLTQSTAGFGQVEWSLWLRLENDYTQVLRKERGSFDAIHLDGLVECVLTVVNPIWSGGVEY